MRFFDKFTGKPVRLVVAVCPHLEGGGVLLSGDRLGDPFQLLLEGLSGQRLSCQGNLHSGEEPEVGRGEIRTVGRLLKHLYIFAGQKIGNTMLQVHTAAFVADFLAGKSVQMLEHPPYRIDLALADFWFFPRVKIALAGKTLSAETFKKESAGVTKMIPAEEYAAFFQTWEDRHNKSDRLAGEYVEKSQ